MISVCMIMKNEEKVIEESLKRISKFDCEIVVVDTGSTDRSVEIAKKYTDKVYFFEWINDFSAARNFSISKAENDVVLILDCDEFIEEADFEKTERLCIENSESVGNILIQSSFESNGIRRISNGRLPRVFSRKYYEYRGGVHEQPERIDKSETTYFDVPLRALHMGYEGNIEERKKKTKRNIFLLNKELEKDPKNTYTLFQLGKSYYVEADYEKAAEYFKRCSDLKPDFEYEYVHDMYETYAYALINLNRIEEALELLKFYDKLSNTADFVFVAGLIYINCGRLSDAVAEFQKALTMKKAKVEGTNSYAANYNIGVIYECVGDKKTALEYYKKCGSYESALKGIERIKGKK